MTIRDWPAGERPREKLLHRGAPALSDAELLAILLRTGIRGCDVLELSRRLLQEFGSLRALFAADAERICAIPGLGHAKYVLLQAVLELGRRHLDETIRRGEALTSPTATRRFLQSRLRDRPREIFALLLLDSQHRVLSFEELFHGTLDCASVYPREVVQCVLKYNAAAVILCHNHPSGVAEPSRADRSLTERISAALGLIDVRVLDHLVIGDGEMVSFAERGWL
ncbi:DNA repair protein RadC [Pseudaeromonas sharmana]|uniref:DNA repair protein RadC n=1 Tax=Pseudaeromonas sharmana TaxID=328412 RepID=A0ABV8CLV2_9GAMM